MKKLPKIGKRFVKNNFEWEVYKGLKNLLPRGATIDYETEKIPYVIHAEYIPDFVITLKSGKKIYVEVKGNGRAFDGNVRRKMIAVKEQNPDIPIYIVFYSDGKIGPIRKDDTFRRQSDWAQANKFNFAVREIPKEWFNE